MNMVKRFMKGNNPLQQFLIIFKNLKFKHKLFISYIVVIIFPLIILGLYSYGQAKSFLLNEAKQGLNESVRQITENLNSKFKRYDTVVSFIVYNTQVVQIINNEDESYFQRYVNYTEILDPLFTTVININNDIDSLVIYSGNDSITERSNSIQLLDRIRQKSWFKEVVADRRVHWIMEDKTIIGLCRFYEPFKNAPLNLIYVKMKYNNIFDIEMKNIKEYGIFVSDKKRNIIFSQNNIGDSRLSNVEKQIALLSQGEVKINGVRCILIKNQIDETGWTLSYLSPVSSIAINAEKIVGATVIIILGCLIILIFVTWIFSNTLVKRINNLNNKMKLVKEGNLRIEVSSASKDEVGELTNQFGAMLKNINTLIDEVYHSKIVQKEAEMKALQAQINPHFLYNTLSLINWKAICIDNMEISQITRNVSKFYRTVLNKGENIISIVDEIANTKCYLEIQLAMHNNGFDVEYRLDDEIFEYDMVKTILQPIVENAIEHGIYNKADGRGKLCLTGFSKDECIFFIIEDNGPGIEKEMLDNIFKQNSGGYGMKNVQERLKIFFGEEYGLSISCETGRGTCVTVRIPKFRQS